MIRIYSVREGNHTGLIEYMTNKALLTGLQLKFGSNIETTLFTEYFGFYHEFGKAWVILHGKHLKYCRLYEESYNETETKIGKSCDANTEVITDLKNL
jgi:hypothetical protein